MHLMQTANRFIKNWTKSALSKKLSIGRSGNAASALKSEHNLSQR
jgi:hypothetical protein